jgi:hypothetical protein
MKTTSSPDEDPRNDEEGNPHQGNHPTQGTGYVPPESLSSTFSSARPNRLRTMLSTLSSSADSEDSFEHIAPRKPLKPALLAAMRIGEPGTSDSVPVPTVPRIEKPGNQTWFRTIGNEAQWDCYFVFSPQRDTRNSIYLVTPEVAASLGSVAKQKRFVPYITCEGMVGFWPLSVSQSANSWTDSARIIAGDARTEWRRFFSDMRAKEYRAVSPQYPKPEPAMPTPEELEALFCRAAEGLIIDSLDHPAVKDLF